MLSPPLTEMPLPASRADTRTFGVPGLVIVLLAIFAGAAFGLLTTNDAETARAVANAGGDLTRLLRAMAAIKTIMAVAAGAAILWRLVDPAPWAMLTGYALAGAAMAAGPGLIWGMVHIGAGALLLHGGLAAAILLLWRDPAVEPRLARLVAARRRAHAPG
jgi:hypothetical protein